MVDLERREAAIPPTMTGDRGGVAVQGRTLTGYAAVYGRVSQPLSDGGKTFRERILPGAFDEVLKRKDDVVATFNHDTSLILGRRSAGTLRLSADSVGLRFTIDLPATTLARDLTELVKRGDIRGASFAFRGVIDKWFRDADGILHREISGFDRLADVAVVTRPAYPDTNGTIAVRDDRSPKRSLDWLRLRIKSYQ